MDLPVIGSHCTLSTCHDLDLLPVTCTSCTKLFCRFHVSRDAHACPVNLNNNVHPASSHKLARCALEPCSKPSLEAFLGSAANQTDRSPAICIRCRRAFCASHRYPESHSCPSPEPDEAVGNTAARQLLERHFPSTSSAPKTARVARATTDPKKIAQLRKVELITLRHRAVPADPKDNHKSTPIPLDQRLHVKVQFDTVRPTLERSFWLRKSLSVGRALDLLADQLGASSSDYTPRQLLRFSDETNGWIALQNDRSLETQIGNGDLLAVAYKDAL